MPLQPKSNKVKGKRSKARPVTAIGCRVKSGWAMTVLVGGSVTAPRVLDRRRIELSDPTVPATVQPYHAAFGTEQTDAAAVRRLTRLVARCASQSVASLLRTYHAMGYRPRRIALVVGSTVDPASIANQHIRAHAHEGRLFRTVVQAAATRHRIRSTVILERELYGVAARRFGGSPQRIQQAATALGQAVGRPWRTEDKAAAVGAWLLLAPGRSDGSGITRVCCWLNRTAVTLNSRL